jgi:uncharacterized OB-fold protein
MDPKITVNEYLAALRENHLLGLKCKECGFITAPPRLACRKCASQANEVTELSGKGKIVSFTTVYVAPEHRRGKTPYTVVLVELDEGSWIMGNVTGIDSTQTSMELIGARVMMDNTALSEEKELDDSMITPLFHIINQI